MMIVDHLVHGHRVLLACVLLGAPSLVSTARRMRREELTGR